MVRKALKCFGTCMDSLPICVDTRPDFGAGQLPIVPA
jgi:hypothetical protein